jgi:dienelactone hydrolase
MSASRFRALMALCVLTFGVASTAHAAPPPPLEAYGKLPTVELMSLSPSGKRYAFIRVTDTARQLVIVPVDGGNPTVVPFAAKDKLRGLEWAGDDHLIALLSGTAHGANAVLTSFEILEALVFPLNNHPDFVVFDSGHGTPYITGQCGFAEINGHWYGYFEGASRGLARVDLDDGQATVVPGSTRGGGCLVDTDGKFVARTGYYQKTGAWWVRAGMMGDVVLSGHSLTNGPGLAGLGRTADTVVVYNPDDAVNAYQIVSLSGGAPQSIPNGDKIDRPLFDRKTKLWMGVIPDGDKPQPVFFSPERQTRFNAARKAFAKYNVKLHSWNDDFSRFIIFTDGGDDSGTYWLVDIGKHSVESVGQAYPDVKEADVGLVSIVDWKAADGLEEHGVLTLPPGRTAHGLPVVVLPHGGPQARDFAVFDWWAQAFASRGYAVFQPNFRGSDGYGIDFVNAGHGQWGRKMQTDISDGLAALAAQGVVDPKRACIVGASYGGYAALAGVTVQHGLYRCAVADAGVADLHQMLKYEDVRSGNTAANATMRYWKQFMGADAPSDSSLDAISPVRLADKADAPVLLIHGKDDSVVPFEQSNAMLAALKHAGKPVEMVVMPNEDHWLSQADTRLSMLTAAVAFVQKYNPAD